MFNLNKYEVKDGVLDLSNEKLVNFNKRAIKKIQNEIKIIKLPQNFSGTLQNFKNLETIVWHDDCKTLPCNANVQNLNAKHIVLPKHLKELNANDFCGANNIEDITITSAECIEGREQQFILHGIKKPIKLILNEMPIFSKIKAYGDIDEVVINDSVKEIETFFVDTIFKNMKKITLPKTLNKIGKSAFYRVNCDELTGCESVDCIEEGAFETAKIKNFSMPQSVREIGDYAFRNFGCDNIKIPQNITKIGNNAFEYSSIKEVVLPKTLNSLGSYAFFTHGLLYAEMYPPIVIGDNVFNFDLLNAIAIKEDGKVICFDSAKYKIEDSVSIKKFSIMTRNDIFTIALLDPAKFKQLQKSINYIEKKEIAGNTMFRLSNFYIKKLYNFDAVKSYCQLNPYFIKNFSKNNLTVDIFEDKYMAFASCFGCFDEDKIERQKGVEFIKECFEEGIFTNKSLKFLSSPVVIHNESTISGMQNIASVTINERLIKKEQSKALYKFLRDKKNIAEILKMSKNSQREATALKKLYNYEGTFFYDVCLNFDEVQKTNTQKNGKQLAPTIQKFIDYFNFNKFNIEDERQIKIAKEVGRFFEDKKTFLSALKIENEFESKNVKHHILNKPLTSELVSDIEKIRQEIIDNLEITLNNVGKSLNSITWEMLDKGDIKNLTLGKYCTCCAHLEGAGEGIMRASIILNYVQNLVFKKNGAIIGKATLFVNEDEGYAIFNNVEINDEYCTNRKVLQDIFKNLLEATYAFKDEYNKTHDKKLIKINIGMSVHNDLEELLGENTPKERELLVPIDYSNFASKNLNNQHVGCYRGDAFEEQSILFEDHSIDL